METVITHARLVPGLTADLVRFRFVDRTPVVRQVVAGGRIVLA